MIRDLGTYGERLSSFHPKETEGSYISTFSVLFCKERIVCKSLFSVVVVCLFFFFSRVAQVAQQALSLSEWKCAREFPHSQCFMKDDYSAGAENDLPIALVLNQSPLFHVCH